MPTLLVVDDEPGILLAFRRAYRGSGLEVLTAEATLLANQRTLTDLETRQFAATVQLIRALGGGWDTSQLPK